MKIWKSEHVFEHPWETVVAAAVRKYPNPYNSNVVALDTVGSHLDGHSLTTQRLMTTRWNAPAWILKLTGISNEALGKETLTVDRENKNYTLKSVNMSFDSVVSIDETLIYTEDPDNPQRTLLHQDMHITVHFLSAFSSYFEALVLKTVETNSSKGRAGIEWVIDNFIKPEATLPTLQTYSPMEISQSTETSSSTSQTLRMPLSSPTSDNLRHKGAFGRGNSAGPISLRTCIGNWFRAHDSSNTQLPYADIYCI